MRRKRFTSVFGLALLMGALTACGGSSPGAAGDVIDVETFIATYVDLRVAAVQSEELRISEAQRDSILDAHGVDGESLVRFADVHGRDLDFMTEVWNEVERRMEEATPRES